MYVQLVTNSYMEFLANDHLPRVSHQLHLSGNDEMILGIYLTAEESYVPVPVLVPTCQFPSKDKIQVPFLKRINNGIVFVINYKYIIMLFKSN